MVGSLGFEPRLPTPQAGILDQNPRTTPRIPYGSMDSGFLDQARLRPQQPTKYEGYIIKTLLQLEKEGKAENTRINADNLLRQLAKKTDLDNSETVKLHIAKAKNEKTGEPLANATKNKLCLAYDWYCKANGLTWTKPFYKVDEGIPIIPTTDNVTKIINASTKRYAVIFTIIAETGAEGEELHRTNRSKIDTEQGTITITGKKGHGSATYKLKQATLLMLKEYLILNPQDHPFPNPRNMAEVWRRTRDKLADTLKQPQLKNIPMKNLRNYSGAKLYYATQDPIAVMRHLRHKKLETTMHYIRGITLNGEEEYTVKTATNIKEATTLLEAGFTYVQDIDGIKLYRKRK